MAIKEKIVGPSTRPVLNLDFANSKSLDPRVNFTRNSTAKAYDVKTTAKMRENLLAYSDLNTNTGSWNYFRTTTSTGQNSPTWADDAISLQGDGGTGFAAGMWRNFNWGSVPPNGSNNEYTFSFFASSNQSDYVFAGCNNANDEVVCFNLSNGTVINSASGYTGTISNVGTNYNFATSSNVGNNWWRCSITFTPGASGTAYSNYIMIGLCKSGGIGSFNGTYSTSESVRIWGPQIESNVDGLAGVPVLNNSDDSFTEYGPILVDHAVDTPRFDHDPVTNESKGLLIEDQVTNAVTDSTAGVNGSGTITISNAIMAPDGTRTASLWRTTWNSSNRTYHYLSPNSYAVTAGQNYVISVYVKDVNISDNVSTFGGGGWSISTYGAGHAQINYNTSGVTKDGWTRIWKTINITSSGTLGIQLFRDQGVGFAVFWGAQVEACEYGASPSSYIACDGSATTRESDKAFVEMNNGLLSQKNYTVYGEFTDIREAGSGGGSRLFRLLPYNDTGSYNRIVDIYYSSGTAIYEFSNTAQGGTTSLGSIGTVTRGSWGVTDEIKIAWATGGGVGSVTKSACINGGSVSSASHGRQWAPGQLDIGGIRGHSTAQLNGYVRKIAIYPEDSSDEMLKAMTESDD